MDELKEVSRLEAYPSLATLTFKYVWILREIVLTSAGYCDLSQTGYLGKPTGKNLEIGKRCNTSLCRDTPGGQAYQLSASIALFGKATRIRVNFKMDHW